MIESHLNAIENVLLAQGSIASNAGHPNLIGGPKEWFVKNFLVEHLPKTIGIGQGEIINSRSQQKSKRNQIDVVLYRQDFPKITYSPDNNAFLRESIIATIEVKSMIDEGKFKKACIASINHKNRQYMDESDAKKLHLPVGVIEDLMLPSIATYVVSYDCPANLSTAAKWLRNVTHILNTTPDKIIDMMIILGKGAIWRLDSFPPFEAQLKSKHPNDTWAFLEQENKNLLLLFLHILAASRPLMVDPKMLAGTAS